MVNTSLGMAIENRGAGGLILTDHGVERHRLCRVRDFAERRAGCFGGGGVRVGLFGMIRGS